MTPVNHYGQTQIVEAQRVVFDPKNFLKNTISSVQNTINAAANTITAGAAGTLLTKELALDGIAFGLAKMIVKSMTQSIVSWINSGFQGSPAFISDLKSFLVDRADEIAGDFIYNNPDLNFLCSPFQLDVKTALAVNYQDQTHGGSGSSAQCTLSEVSDNIEGFLSGNFADGGWPAMFELTQNPQNTPTGAYLAAEAELNARIADDQGRTVKELDWGKGFLSFKVCDGGASGSGNPNQKCDITTPGKVIADQLNKSLGAGQDALIEADEINEIIGALFAQLAQQALTGLNGLLGLGGSQQYSSGGYGANGNQSFLDAMLEEDINSDNPGLQTGDEPIQNAISSEQAYIALQQQIIDAVNDAETKVARLNELYQDKDSDKPNFCTTTFLLPNSLEREREQARSSIATSENNLVKLESIAAEYASSTSAAERNEAITPFLELSSQNEIKNEIDITRLQLEIDNEFDAQIDEFNTDLQRSVNRCERNNDGRTLGGAAQGAGTNQTSESLDVLWPEQIDFSALTAVPVNNESGETLVSENIIAGTCTEMVMTPQNAARNEEKERTYALYTDVFGNEKMVDITDEEASSDVEAAADISKLPFDFSAGSNKRIIHTHPRSTVQRLLGMERKGPSVPDLQTLCNIRPLVEDPEEWSFYAYDADTVWHYYLTDPSQCPFDESQQSQLTEAEVYGILREVPASERDEYAKDVQDLLNLDDAEWAAEEPFWQQGSTMSTQELIDAQRNLLTQNGVQIEELAPADLCSEPGTAT